ncbi:recombinase family protein [Thermodesulfobacteriota bacterium]
MTRNGGHDVAYVRVSSVDQNTDRQLNGMEFERTFTEKASAKDVKRPVLQECFKYLREGDTLHVHSIDRLARNLFDLQDIVTTLTSRGIHIQFHKENLSFTGDDSPMQKLMLQMMGAFSEFERSLIKERQREGIQAAKAAGKQVGAKRKLSPEQVEEIQQRIQQGEEKKALAKEYGVSRQTLYSAISG